MQKFTKLTGVAAPLPMRNIDTDMIIPKQFLKTIARTGLGKSLFFEMRYDQDGKEIPDFVINKPAYRKARDPGHGRELRLRLLPRARALGAARFRLPLRHRPDFADIFFNNCFKNGILPIRLPQAQVDKLMDDASRGANATITVDLETQEIRGPDGGMIKFEVDPFRKHCLLNGLDDIGLTLEKEESIKAFEETAHAARPWA